MMQVDVELSTEKINQLPKYLACHLQQMQTIKGTHGKKGGVTNSKLQEIQTRCDTVLWEIKVCVHVSGNVLTIPQHAILDR